MRFKLLSAFVAASIVAVSAQSVLAQQNTCYKNHAATVHVAQPVHMTVSTTTAAPVAAKDIVDTAVGAGQFKTLVAAVQAAGLVDALKSEGPFTVFAPTDEAFAKLPAGTVETLLKPENKEQLAAVLKYHVVSGKVMAGDVLKAMEVNTLQGSKAKLSLSIDGAKIVKTDIDCANGVIHVIDSVILHSK